MALARAPQQQQQGQQRNPVLFEAGTFAGVPDPSPDRFTK